MALTRDVDSMKNYKSVNYKEIQDIIKVKGHAVCTRKYGKYGICGEKAIGEELSPYRAWCEEHR